MSTDMLRRLTNCRLLLLIIIIIIKDATLTSYAWRGVLDRTPLSQSNLSAQGQTSCS